MARGVLGEHGSGRRTARVQRRSLSCVRRGALPQGVPISPGQHRDVSQRTRRRGAHAGRLVVSIKLGNSFACNGLAMLTGLTDLAADHPLCIPFPGAGVIRDEAAMGLLTWGNASRPSVPCRKRCTL
jgi:hypothetical protein